MANSAAHTQQDGTSAPDHAGQPAGSRGQDRSDLTQGSVGAALLRLAGPMLFGIAAVISVQLVDTYFVGKLGTEPLAALSFTFPVALTLTSLAIGMAAGAASVVSRSIGQGRRRNARRRAFDALVLATTIAVALAALGLVLVRPLFELLGADGQVLEYVVAYMRIWFLSLPFVVVPMVANSMLRAWGEAFWPSFTMIAASVINAGATPLLIFGYGPVPEMGIEGAAAATLLARMISLAMALYLVSVHKRIVRFCLPGVKAFADSARRILAVGIPAALGNASNPAGVIVATALIAVLGSQTVAAFGVATRIEAFAILPMLALSSAIGPVTGQNWGAGRIDRARQALMIAFGFCAAWAVVLAGLFWMFGETVAGWFASEPAVAEEAAVYLAIVPLSLFGYGIAIVAAGAFNGIGRSVTGLGYSLTRALIFYVPLVWAASRIDGSRTVYLAIAAANALAGFTIAGHSLWILKRIERTRSD